MEVAIPTVRVLVQRSPCRAVRIVFPARYLRRHAKIVAPEVDTPVLPLVPAALMAGRDMALVVAAARPLERLEQGALGFGLRELPEVRHRTEPRRRRDRLELSDTHISPRTPGSRRPL